MSRLDAILGSIVGLSAVIVVYIAFVAHEFVEGGHVGKAVGVGALLSVFGRPLFLAAAIIAFLLAFYRVVR